MPAISKRPFPVVFAFLLLSAFGLPPARIVRAAEPSGPAEPPAVDLLWGVQIPMRDGVKLNATVYTPHDQTRPLPVVFTLTPYTADSYHERAMYFARHGYVFALVDVRGRGNSEGTFEPFANEAHDGYDTVEWFASQPYCDGKVAMWGGSYAGFDQWATAKELPPHLATIVPAAAACAGVDFPFFQNVFASYDIQWLTFTSGVTANANLFSESSFWIDKFRQMYLGYRPYRELDRIVGNLSTVFRKWLAHPTPDGYWLAMRPTPAQYAKIAIPILTITGDYDGDQPGALHYYRSHMKYGTPEARARHFLIIGPWDHPGTRTPKKSFGGMTFGDASVLDLNDLHRQWYDWTMKSGPKPDFLKERIAYFVAGADEWKYAPDLDSVASERRTLYLASDGNAGDIFHSGSFESRPAGRSKPDRFTYDPLDTRPAELERKDIESPITDERDALNLFGDGVVYHSSPFSEDTEVAGALKLVLYLAMDVPDTDLAVSVSEIQADGKSITLTSDLLRARYRDSLTEAKIVRPGEIDRYVFDHFTWFCRRIAKGSRLRLVISCPNTIYLEKNYNSGGTVADESAKDARTAHIILYHDARRPSALEIPVVRAAR